MAFRPNWYDDEPRRGRSPLLGGMDSWSGLKTIVVFTVGVYALQVVTPVFTQTWRLEDWFGLRAWYGFPGGLRFNYLFPVQLVTYAFLHGGLWHLVWNLLFLWIFGSETEALQGRRAFLRMYLSAAVFAGLVTWVFNLVQGETIPTIGASGAIYTVLIVFVLRDPQRTIMLLFPPIPMPAWVLAGFRVLLDLVGFIQQQQGFGAGVAHVTHLAGALYGWIWFKQGDYLARWTSRYKRHKHAATREKHESNRREMDRILAKIQSSGLSSLDKRERAFLDQRSEEFRQGRR